MRWRMFGQGMKAASVRELSTLRRLLRLTRSSEGADLGITSSMDSSQSSDNSDTLDPQVYLLATRRMHEVETQKAMAIVELRHERWKAGGPQ